LGGTILLFYLGCQIVDFENNSNGFLGISARDWFMFSMMIPLLHQAYVWLCWRSELCWKTISNTIGFKGYAMGFFVVGLLRFSCIGLCFADFGSLFNPGWIAWIIAGIIFVPVSYTLYSVASILDFYERVAPIILIQVIRVFPLKKEEFSNGFQMPCIQLPC